MPYVDTEAQHFLLTTWDPHTAGELNFCISALCLRYLNESAGKYSDMNEIVGALECAKQEFVRRVLTPYEQVQAALPGRDIYADRD